MRSSDTVSVVVTTYYRNELLERALGSVAKQTHEDIEVLVVDGSGEAHAEPVVSDDAIYIAQDRDQGPHAARQLGAEHASGSYIQFLDDDDRLKPQKIQKQVELLKSDDDVGVAYCGYENESGGLLMPNHSVAGDVLEAALRFDLPPCNTSTMLIEDWVVEAILPFRNKHGADDIGMKIELAKRTHFDFIDSPLVIRGQPEYSLGSSWSAIEGRQRILEMYDELYDGFPPSVRKTAVANIFENKGQRYIEESAWSLKAIWAYFNMIRYAPDPTPKQWGQFLSSFLGRRGFNTIARLWRSGSGLSLNR